MAGRAARPGLGGVVPRPGLSGRLAGSARVTVLSAPPGSGKTVLLRSWMAEPGRADRAAWVPVGRGEQDPQRFFNTSVFKTALAGTFGNVGRGTLDSPGIIGWDFSMHKDFTITERHRLQFRFEGFNFPNHPNWNGPNTNIASGASFGTITSTRGNMRNLQVALKYSF